MKITSVTGTDKGRKCTMLLFILLICISLVQHQSWSASSSTSKSLAVNPPTKQCHQHIAKYICSHYQTKHQCLSF